MNRKPRLLLDTVRWYARRLRPDRSSYDHLLTRAVGLGMWLRKCDYTGIDVSVDNPPKAISTVPALAMVGWLNLCDITGDKFYRDQADECLGRILAEQTEEGCWLFPYRFRDNPAGFPYSCENFMTIECLMDYWNLAENSPPVLRSLEKGLAYLLEAVGNEGGIFWYSARDRIRVPNISSMAARAFATGSQMIGNPEYLRLAEVFAEYCISQQSENGGYPYLQDDPRVYVPYHALEIWELAEANKVLRNPNLARSIRRAVTYLLSFINRNGYESWDPVSPGTFLMKTPVWSAKALLAADMVQAAFRHLTRGLEVFRVPAQDSYFYILSTFRAIKVPVFDSCFIRYNASTFEVCTSLAKEMHRAM